MMIAPPRKHRRPSLTPMIDVVFLLLVFFMLASRFGADTIIELPLAGATASETPYQGPPRLVDIAPESLALNGAEIGEAALPDSLAALMQAPEDTVILRPRDGAGLQRVVGVLEALRAAGMTNLVLVE